MVHTRGGYSLLERVDKKDQYFNKLVDKRAVSVLQLFSEIGEKGLFFMLKIYLSRS